ncbi:lysozyme family protein [Sporolactobacillus spathodeae]|uniref:Soluble lytic murein transglycosylase-like protein n=1 Tax=Sporolactobacillus spathodeae TaxID=1465502 RepID=A0ABS2Q639_9BACL|nr:soluble lytic murein transglycosylase-like protein [Sporolactobacillus spathodeae]
MKKLLVWIVSMLTLIGFSYLLLFIISSKFSPAADHVPFLNDDRVISQKIEAYRPVFKKYARVYGLENKTDLLMAMAMQESKGNSVDVMQASESQGLPRDSIKDPTESIAAGTKYFRKSLDQSNGDVRLALQSYNFGIGFTDYVRAHGGQYSQALADQFAKKKAAEFGWRSYGDPHYVSHVLRYYYNEKEKQAIAKKSDS